MELDYLLDFRGLVLVEFGTQNSMGGCRGDFPPNSVVGGSRGLVTLHGAPRDGGFGEKIFL